jgi:hypothetical protein
MKNPVHYRGGGRGRGARMRRRSPRLCWNKALKRMAPCPKRKSASRIPEEVDKQGTGALPHARKSSTATIKKDVKLGKAVGTTHVKIHKPAAVSHTMSGRAVPALHVSVRAVPFRKKPPHVAPYKDQHRPDPWKGHRPPPRTPYKQPPVRFPRQGATGGGTTRFQGFRGYIR